MKINKIAVVITVVVLILIFLGFYLGGYFKPSNNNTQGQQNTNNQMDQTSNAAAPKINITTLKEGNGAEAKSGNKLTVDYVGTLEDGTKFDSSIDRGTPFSFTLGASQVIKGWDEGLMGMKVGEKRKLTIPPELGYGAQGAGGGKIPPNSTLIFEIDLLKIN